MITLRALVLVSTMGIGSASEPPSAIVPKGCLVVEGGGKASPAVRSKILAIAGGPDCHLVIIPQASALADSGLIAAQRWRNLGARDVTIIDLADRDACLASIRRADLVWIGGGDQERLMKALKGSGIPEAIRARYNEGGTVAGSSAGAAVMSKVMIARGGEDFPKPLANFPIMSEGLGLWPEVIVDQHFLKLNRTPRLARAVEEFPDLVGVGIDESTAVIVRGKTIEVVGESRVVVIDQRRAHSGIPVSPAALSGGGDGAPLAREVSGPKISTLNPGVTYDVDRGMILDSIAGNR